MRRIEAVVVGMEAARGGAVAMVIAAKVVVGQSKEKTDSRKKAWRWRDSGGNKGAIDAIHAQKTGVENV